MDTQTTNKRIQISLIITQIKQNIIRFLDFEKSLQTQGIKETKPETKIWNAFETISLFAPPPTSNMITNI